jgi:hypothetical protein
MTAAPGIGVPVTIVGVSVAAVVGLRAALRNTGTAAIADVKEAGQNNKGGRGISLAWRQ